jgi:hypothetical protein
VERFRAGTNSWTSEVEGSGLQEMRAGELRLGQQVSDPLALWAAGSSQVCLESHQEQVQGGPYSGREQEGWGELCHSSGCQRPPGRLVHSYLIPAQQGNEGRVKPTATRTNSSAGEFSSVLRAQSVFLHRAPSVGTSGSPDDAKGPVQWPQWQSWSFQRQR